ncbi:PTS sugar transporter subunit IIC [Haloferax mediterranei ATCC 33500]|uniref:PTS sugar transporter subunit IIC n=1 Tax=Haloferax mediterranei (strain ATCC 33500 / DSM 1411 / JCM 8866 / NBRC 14739 / NCIMB 2177 / R-4) TaxID=523841 RepID=I3R4V6_HALMT|nr:fructose PTS transporter subunit IIB [Haloferax mediterranei]AFK19266.1 sugar phosphotransferase system (PTS) IIB component [Haloferax mediterranei ATCC 33500]AHZ21375.1 PTS sugar transporter subunit IIC [Haloferax mediterranei ATCC 33500]EMA04545.1 sugar phosphotransferase system (PTS) IIB component [Haloferax mediterranei ATCC 33500]MDX5989369.1 fructose PTS transporter subunit IIB [Haloferax mediterranei ATCC 33500]QCQ75733.1 PTS sugar transporter subunit IIC [Haloferax mediterranei ATCC
MKFVAVTSCPTGIAHSQMAAENLLQIAERLGHDIDVEVQGAMGTQDELDADAIAEADAVIITSDTSVSRDRFEGKLVLKGTVKDGVNNAEAVIEKAAELADAGKTGSVTFGSGEGAADADAEAAASSEAESGAERAQPDEPVRRGGDPEKGLFARLKKLFS